MKRLVFLDGIEDLYAMFGKRMPAGRVLEVIWERIQNLPDGFLAYAKTCLENEEKPPANMGRYLVNDVWPEYRRINGIQINRNCDCPECKGDQAISAYAPDGISWSFPCICQHPKGGYTRSRILELGYSFCDPLAPSLSHKNPDPIAKKILSVIGRKFSERKEHTEYLAQMDAQEW